eukprot:CCRYP_017623-RA/>CCRYP_017623-RA protein AED:0.45 eAED:0.50 QI:0/0/0/1/0/0/2/0/76
MHTREGIASGVTRQQQDARQNSWAVPTLQALSNESWITSLKLEYLSQHKKVNAPPYPHHPEEGWSSSLGQSFTPTE